MPQSSGLGCHVPAVRQAARGPGSASSSRVRPRCCHPGCSGAREETGGVPQAERQCGRRGGEPGLGWPWSDGEGRVLRHSSGRWRGSGPPGAAAGGQEGTEKGCHTRGGPGEGGDNTSRLEPGVPRAWSGRSASAICRRGVPGVLRRGPVAAEPSVLALPGCGAQGRCRPRRSLTPPRCLLGGGRGGCRPELPPSGLQPVAGDVRGPAPTVLGSRRTPPQLGLRWGFLAVKRERPPPAARRLGSVLLRSPQHQCAIERFLCPPPPVRMAVPGLCREHNVSFERRLV